MDNESIQFIANFDKFISVKKLTIDNKVKPTDVIEFLAGIQFTVNQKITDYVEKLIDVEKFNESTKYVYDLDREAFFKELRTRKLRTLFLSYLPDNLDKKADNDAYINLFRVYLVEKYAVKNKLILSTHHIVFPRNKKLMKKR